MPQKASQQARHMSNPVASQHNGYNYGFQPQNFEFNRADFSIHPELNRADMSMHPAYWKSNSAENGYAPEQQPSIISQHPVIPPIQTGRKMVEY